MELPHFLIVKNYSLLPTFHDLYTAFHLFVIPRLHDTTGCQTGCATGLTTGCILYTNTQPVQPVVKTVLYRVNKHPTGLTTVLNEQLFVQPVVKPGCTTRLTTGCRYSRLSNRIDNRLNVYIHDTTGCETGLETGCIVCTNIYLV